MANRERAIEHSSSDTNHNQNAHRFRSLDYNKLGGHVIRDHTTIDHTFGFDWFRPIHIPVDREGVVP